MIPLPPLFTMDNTSQESSVASSARRERIALHIQKQLATDIEENGGIDYFVGENNNQRFSQLLDERSEEEDNPYGLRGNPFREKLWKKAQYWSKLQKKGKYIEKILNPWGIVQYSARQSEQAGSPPPTTPRKTSRRNKKKAPSSTPSRKPTPSAPASDISVSGSESGGESSSSGGDPRAAAGPKRVTRAATKKKSGRPPKQVVVKSPPQQAAAAGATGLELQFQEVLKMSDAETPKRKLGGGKDWADIVKRARKCQSFVGWLDFGHPELH